MTAAVIVCKVIAMVAFLIAIGLFIKAGRSQREAGRLWEEAIRNARETGRLMKEATRNLEEAGRIMRGEDSSSR